MNTLGIDAGPSMTALGKQILVFLLSIALLSTGCGTGWAATTNASAGQDTQGAAQPYTKQSSDQLRQLVAPIALYPDSLVAQILAASTFPDQIVEADRWVQAHPDLKGDDLAKAVDKQPWDASVKALTAFPSVLGNMDKNLSWTSSLGDAYYNQEKDVMDAVQEMREKADKAGNLKDTPQQTVEKQGSTIVIQPAQPDVVYVPAYDPWAIYGYPIAPWPYWYQYPGIWFGGPYLSFGLGFGIGFFGGFGWGWGHWGCDWRGHYGTFDHNRYYSRSNTFYNRNSYYRGGGERGVARNVNRGSGGRGGNAGGRGGERGGGGRGGASNRGGGNSRAFGGNTRQARGFGEGRGQSGMRSGAFSGFGHGGSARGFGGRGRSSFGGGGFHGGGGGRGGGGRR